MKNFRLDIEGSLHEKIFSYILILIPFALVTGPFLPDLFLSLIGFYFLFISIKKGLISYYKNYFVLFFILVYFYLFFRGIFSDYPYESLISYNGPIFYFRYLFFILGFKYLIDLNSNLVKYFSYYLLFIILFSSLYGYFQWITDLIYLVLDHPQ